MASTTRMTLVQRIRSGEDESWREVEQMYTPLIRATLRQFGFQAQDIDDLTQEVMLSLHRKLEQFEHNGRTGAFRRWLRVVTTNQAKVFLRRPSFRTDVVVDDIESLADDESCVAREFEKQHDLHVLAVMMSRVAADFTPNTMESFRRYVIEGQEVERVARDLNMSSQAIYIAKSRVLRSLRAMAADYDVSL